MTNLPTPPRPERYASPGGAYPPGAVPSSEAVQDTPPYGGAAAWQHPAGCATPGPGCPGIRGTTDPDDMTLPFYGASFGVAVKRFFTGYVRFRGRASRSEYWWVQLFMLLISIAVSVVLVAVMVSEMSALSRSEMDRLAGSKAATMTWVFDTPSVAVVFVVASVFGLAMLLPILALGWRRLQDANVSGGWTFVTLVLQLVSYVPVVGSLVSMGALAWWIVVGTLSTKPEGQRFDRP